MSDTTAVRFLDRTTPPHIVTLVMLAGLSAMTMSIFLPSLPAMAVYFDAPYAVIQLAVSLYLAASALMQLIIGPLSDRYGRRPVMLSAIAVFLVATLGCVLAPNVHVFLVCRMLQTVVVTGLVLSRAVVRDMYPPSESASMIGYVTMGMSLVPMFAPMLGGAIDQIFDWKATFLFLLLAGTGVGWLAWRDMGETAGPGAASLVAQFRGYPDLLASRRFWGYALAVAFSAGAFYSFLGGVPYVSTEIFRLSPVWTGVGFGAPSVGYLLGNYLSGRFSASVGINRMILIGASLSTVGLVPSLVLSHLGFDNPVLFFAFVTFVGLGNGIVIPNGTAGTLSVRPELAGTASGLGGTLMIGGGAALSVLAGVLLQGGHSSLPLQWLMFCCALMSLVAILYVNRRERNLGLAP
ncbi:multidrug effflux MFS transporter [Tropicimonas sp. IMCC34043]|uniref:multidrug effflux MFS transporter n=1 Tax=Tropicimonas sp. IMCC34043 TaxID=2248760 RepID=UPI000E246289|nr:multidrug effflux MFS transporter [Tropicimonas sp. IMCC34043]